MRSTFPTLRAQRALTKWIENWICLQLHLLSPFHDGTCLYLNISLYPFSLYLFLSLTNFFSICLRSIPLEVNGRLTVNITTKEDSIYIKWNDVETDFETCLENNNTSGHSCNRINHFFDLFFNVKMKFERNYRTDEKGKWRFEEEKKLLFNFFLCMVIGHTGSCMRKILTCQTV